MQVQNGAVFWRARRPELGSTGAAVYFARRRTVAHRSDRHHRTGGYQVPRSLPETRDCREGEDTWDSGKVQSWLDETEKSVSWEARERCSVLKELQQQCVRVCRFHNRLFRPRSMQRQLKGTEIYTRRREERHLIMTEGDAALLVKGCFYYVASMRQRLGPEVVCNVDKTRPAKRGTMTVAGGRRQIKRRQPPQTRLLSLL